MALYEDVLSAIDQYKPTQDRTPQEISLKITPQQQAQLADATGTGNQQPSSVGGQTGGAGAAGGSSALPSVQRGQQSLMGGASVGTNQIPGPYGFGEAGASIATAEQRAAPRNPQLPSIPSSPYVDDIFTSQVAMLRNQATQQYLQLLRQLGSVGENGEFIPGTIETEAARRRADLEYGRERAQEQVTGDVRRRSAVFSGRHSDLQAQARHPYERDLSQLQAQVPQALADAYSQMMQIMTDVGLGQNMYLAEAAARAAEAARLRSAGATSSAAPAGSTSTAAPYAGPMPTTGAFVSSPHVGLQPGETGWTVPGRGTHLTDGDEGGYAPSGGGQISKPDGSGYMTVPTPGTVFTSTNGSRWVFQGMDAAGPIWGPA